MTALLKVLVLLAIFLSASFGSAFMNHARLNYLIRFDASKSNPTIKPSHVPNSEPTNDRMTTNNQMAFGHNELFKLIKTNSNITSYTFEAVNGVNHDHDKIKVDTWQSLPELELDPGDFSSDSSQAPNLTIHQDREGEMHSESVSMNVESPHGATRVKRVTFSDERDNEIQSKSPVESDF